MSTKTDKSTSQSRSQREFHETWPGALMLVGSAFIAVLLGFYILMGVLVAMGIGCTPKLITEFSVVVTCVGVIAVLSVLCCGRLSSEAKRRAAAISICTTCVLLALAFHEESRITTTICLTLTCFLTLSFQVCLRVTSLKHCITRLCVCFLTLTLIFASAYHIMFVRYPQGFLFSEQMWSAQKFHSFSQQCASLEEALTVHYVYLCFASNPEQAYVMVKDDKRTGRHDNSDHTKTYSFSPTVSARCRWTTVVAWGFSGDSKGIEYCVNGTWMRQPLQLATVDLFVNSNSLDDCQRHLREAVSRTKGYMQKLQSSIDALVKEEQDWRLWDFWYFSVVTMTTLGYGDVIPCCRLSRMLAMSQSLAGVLFIAYALHLLSPSQRSEAASSNKPDPSDSL